MFEFQNVARLCSVSELSLFGVPEDSDRCSGRAMSDPIAERIRPRRFHALSRDCAIEMRRR